jgi:hypothetical protein
VTITSGSVAAPLGLSFYGLHRIELRLSQPAQALDQLRREVATASVEPVALRAWVAACFAPASMPVRPRH